MRGNGKRQRQHTNRREQILESTGKEKATKWRNEVKDKERFREGRMETERGSWQLWNGKKLKGTK